LIGFHEATDPVAARTTIDRTLVRVFARLTNSISACRGAVLEATVLVLVEPAIAIAAHRAIRGAVLLVFSPTAQTVAAREHTILGADQGPLSHFALTVATGSRAIPRTDRKCLSHTAKAVTATAAIKNAGEETLHALADTIPASREAVLGAGTSV